jgi:hypothetical protein
MDGVQNRLRDQGERFLNRGSEMPTWENVQCAATDMIDERPIAATLVVFGVGLGVGVALGTMLGECFAEQTVKRTNYETITQNVMDNLSRMVPEAVARHFRA